jgi:hypothetical protein
MEERKTTVTQEEIDALLSSSTIEVEEKFGKCTIVSVQLPNGFVVTEQSCAVDPENFVKEIGEEICLNRIKNKLWELCGFNLQQKLYEETPKKIPFVGTLFSLTEMEQMKKSGMLVIEASDEKHDQA